MNNRCKSLSCSVYGNSVKRMMGMNQNMFVFLSEGAAPFPALRSCVPIEQLCVLACGTTIEGTTQTPVWCYTPTPRRMGAGERTSD
jgi:hypothetical protein